MRASCRSREWQTPFFPFRQIFTTLLGVPRSGSIAEKTRQLLDNLERNSFYRTIPHRALLKAVLAVDLIDTQATKRMMGKTKADATVACLVNYLTARSFTKSILLVFDDVQWMDSDSFSLLEKLLDVSGIAIVVSSRKGRQGDRPFMDFMARTKKITLQPFVEKETKVFIMRNLSLDGMDPHILSFVQRRTDGVPATLALLLHSLIESSIFVVDGDHVLGLNPNKVADPSQLERLETPDSVLGLIRTNIAKLDPRSLDILFVAATIGRYVPLQLLRDTMKSRVTDSFQSGLSSGVMKSLIDGGILEIENDGKDRTQNGRSAVISFCSGTTQKCVYEMQSEEGRSANHLATAHALQIGLGSGKFDGSLGSNGTGQRGRRMSLRSRRGTRRRGSIAPIVQQQGMEAELYPKIAYHLRCAGKKIKALEFYFKAGRSLARSGLVGASDLFEQCLVIANSLGDECSDFMKAEYAFHLAKALLSNGQNVKSQEAARQALELLGEDSNYSDWTLLSGLTWLWLSDFACLVTEHVAAGEVKEKELLVKTLSVYSLAASNSSEAMTAAYSVVRGAVIGRGLRKTRGGDQDALEALVTFDAALCTVLLFAGFPMMAEKALRQAATGMEELCLFGTWELYLYQGAGYFGLGLFEESKATFKIAIDQAREVSNLKMRMQYLALTVQLQILTSRLDDANANAAELFALENDVL